MCGMLGWFGRDPFCSRPETALPLRLLAHRGPDDAGWETGDGWGLGFRRLSILDLTVTGHQPMRSADGRYCIVFNGEIYNYQELRREMESSGWAFRGTSDSEVLLALLSKDGAGALPRLNGMFAFAFVDASERRFLVARDRLGVKPLYLARHRGGLVFASELKALLAMPGASTRLNLTSTAQYMALNYLPSESCILEGYEKVMPAHVLTGSLDEPESAQPRRYWHLDIQEREDGDITPGALDELDALLEDATRIRLRSDVPVGVFLSGGIDSGLVAAYASSSGATMPPPRAFTVAFSEAGSDETGLATQTAARLRVEHTLIECQPARLDQVDRLAWYFDEPFGDASALPTFALCEAASRFGKVFLSGDGGDEAFGGYERYLETKRLGWMARLPAAARVPSALAARTLPGTSALRYKLVKASLPDAGFAAGFDSIPEDPVLAEILEPQVGRLLRAAGTPMSSRWSRTSGRSLLARQQALDYALYLPDDILVKVDRASMAHSIEVRSPLLDYRVVEWAARQPRGALCSAAEGKRPLRALAARHLPQDVRRGKKRGFGVPLDRWFRRDAGIRFLRDRLLSREAIGRSLWTETGVTRLIDVHVAGRGRDFSAVLWRMLVFDAWARQYLDSASFLQGPPKAAA